MRARNVATSVFLIVLSGTLSAHAQGFERGTIVRVAYQCAEPPSRDAFCVKRGPFHAIVSDSVVLVGRPVATAIPLAAVTKIETRIGRRVSAARALGYPAVGVVIGGLTGYLIGYASCAPCTGEWAGVGVGAAMALGGVAGFATGLVAGLIPRDVWEDTSVDRMSVGVAPHPDGGMRFGASFSF